MVAATPAQRAFVPQSFTPANVEEIEPLYRALLARPVETVEQLERWLLDASELYAVIDEYGARRYIEKSCQTDDPERERAFLHYVEQVEPRVKPLQFAVQQKYMQSPARGQLKGKRYAVLDRRWAADAELFREANVPVETELAKLVTEYDKTMGAMAVDFRGQAYTPQQMARFLEEPDRPTRQDAWEAVVRRRLAEREKVDGLFDRIVSLRDRLGRNADLSDFRAWIWKSYKRFDYTPDDCLRFADAIAATVVPAVQRLHRRRAADLGLDGLRPWDFEVDPRGRPRLRPFDESRVDELVGRTRAIFERLSPQLAAEFDTLGARNNLDLATRKGKQPGGYQYSLEESREPFIFMNAAGVHRDVVTLLHEGGHAFHCLAARDEPLSFLRPAPIEFCEVASMSMELLAADHFDTFYDAEGAARARRSQYERVLTLLPSVALTDSFQHWLYTHPRHTRDERTAEWLRLTDRFAGGVDWSGHEDARAALWQRTPHLFGTPFYYVEYGIAQLGALQLWMKSRENPRQALANYRAALALGGTRPLPELFAAAGIEFDFTERTIRPLVAALEREIEALPG
jgi:oligoendopeptidase F